MQSISIKEYWKKAVQHEMDARMQKLKEFIESRPSMDDVHQEAGDADFSQLFNYTLWDEEKIALKLKEYLERGYSEEKAYVSVVRPWMKAVKQFMGYVTTRDLDKEGAGVGRETYIFSWNAERFVSEWWQPYLAAIRFTGVKSTVPRNSYGVNLGQLVLDYNGCRAILWEWNGDTYFCPYTSADEDFSEVRCPDSRFLKFKRLTLSALTEYLKQMPQATEQVKAIKALISSCY